jgi:hypothetical protein
MNKYLVMLTTSVALLSACASTPQSTATQPAAAKVATPAPAAAKPSAANISGTWTLNLETPMGARDMKLVATQSGETLTGSIASPRGDMPINGTVKGNAVAFSMKVNAQGMDMEVQYAGTVEGNAMKGTAKFGDMGEGSFTAKKD